MAQSFGGRGGSVTSVTGPDTTARNAATQAQTGVDALKATDFKSAVLNAVTGILTVTRTDAGAAPYEVDLSSLKSSDRTSFDNTRTALASNPDNAQDAITALDLALDQLTAQSQTRETAQTAALNSKANRSELAELLTAAQLEDPADETAGTVNSLLLYLYFERKIQKAAGVVDAATRTMKPDSLMFIGNGGGIYHNSTGTAKKWSGDPVSGIRRMDAIPVRLLAAWQDEFHAQYDRAALLSWKDLDEWLTPQLPGKVTDAAAPHDPATDYIADEQFLFTVPDSGGPWVTGAPQSATIPPGTVANFLYIADRLAADAADPVDEAEFLLMRFVGVPVVNAADTRFIYGTVPGANVITRESVGANHRQRVVVVGGDADIVIQGQTKSTILKVDPAQSPIVAQAGPENTPVDYQLTLPHLSEWDFWYDGFFLAYQRVNTLPGSPAAEVLPFQSSEEITQVDAVRWFVMPSGYSDAYVDGKRYDLRYTGATPHTPGGSVGTKAGLAARIADGWVIDRPNAVGATHKQQTKYIWDGGNTTIYPDQMENIGVMHLISTSAKKETIDISRMPIPTVYETDVEITGGTFDIEPKGHYMAWMQGATQWYIYRVGGDALRPPTMEQLWGPDPADPSAGRVPWVPSNTILHQSGRPIQGLDFAAPANGNFQDVAIDNRSSIAIAMTPVPTEPFTFRCDSAAGVSAWDVAADGTVTVNAIVAKGFDLAATVDDRGPERVIEIHSDEPITNLRLFPNVAGVASQAARASFVYAVDALQPSAAAPSGLYRASVSHGYNRGLAGNPGTHLPYESTKKAFYLPHDASYVFDVTVEFGMSSDSNGDYTSIGGVFYYRKIGGTTKSLDFGLEGISNYYAPSSSARDVVRHSRTTLEALSAGDYEYWFRTTDPRDIGGHGHPNHFNIRLNIEGLTGPVATLEPPDKVTAHYKNVIANGAGSVTIPTTYQGKALIDATNKLAPAGNQRFYQPQQDASNSWYGNADIGSGVVYFQGRSGVFAGAKWYLIEAVYA